MLAEKHKQKLREVMDEIQTALEDMRGLAIHQSRLADMISLGATNLIELYLHNLQLMKAGGRLEHQWFRSKQEKVLARIEQQIVSSAENIPKIKEILALASGLEQNRNDLVYGSPVGDEAILKNKIRTFLELKKLIENEAKI